MSDKTDTKYKQEVLEILTNKGVKPTAVRELVLNVFLNQKHALTSPDIEKFMPWGDRVTLFRTLKTFEQKGIIHKVNDGSSTVKYALCSDGCESSSHFDVHPHFHCEKCGKTICLDKQEIELPLLPEGIVVNDYSLVLNGLCADCTKKEVQ